MDASQLPKGQALEVTPGRTRNLPGIYRHEAAGKEIITVADENDGSIQADALVRVGYKRVGDVPSRAELLAMREAQLKKDLEAEKAGATPSEEEVGSTFNGTVTPTVTELTKAKEQVEAELAEAKKTLAALQTGLKKEEKAK